MRYCDYLSIMLMGGILDANLLCLSSLGLVR